MATGVDALIAPKAFRAKDKDPETLLIDFDLYVKTIKNFFVATGKDNATEKQKVALLQAVGGPDMVDMVEEVGKVVLVDTPEDDVLGIAAVTADTFEQAIGKIRDGVVGKTNQAMSRLKLFQQMAQGNQKFASWHKEILKQAKRCNWSNYGVEDAARDAILYQTTDQKLRKKILASNLSYQDTVHWGQSNEEATRKAHLVEETTDKSEDRVRRLEQKLARLQGQHTAEKLYQADKRCQTCSRPRHGPEQACPGLKCPECHACKQKGHFKGAPICPGPMNYMPGTAKTKLNSQGKIRRMSAKTSEDDSEEEKSETEAVGKVSSVTVGAVGGSNDDVEVQVGIRPRTCSAKIWAKWTADSGVRKTLLSQATWEDIKHQNSGARLRKNCTRFVPYGTNQTLPILGKAKVQLECQEGKRIYTPRCMLWLDRRRICWERGMQLRWASSQSSPGVRKRATQWRRWLTSII